MSAISAIDLALWDIKGKALGVPIYELLGGKVRDRVRVYANGWPGGAQGPESYAERAVEEPILYDDAEAMAALARETRVPVATGEQLYTR